MAEPNNVLATVKTGILNLLSGHASVTWTNSRSIMEVTEFGVPRRRWGRSLQMILHGEPWGQAGGMFNFNVSLELAVVVRMSRDASGRFDRILEACRLRLLAVQRALEGQAFDYLELPLYTDLGPTNPEFFEIEPAFAFSYLGMSATKFQVLYKALDLPNWAAFNQHYDNPV